MTEPPRRYGDIAPQAPEGDFRIDRLISGDGPLELDVGFGRGGSLLSRAEAAPDSRLVGIEVKPKWAYRVAERCRGRGLDNVRAMTGDAKALLARATPDGCISRTFVHFPDPWWKKRHAKRRLVDEQFLGEIARLTKRGGELFIQTDVEDRARGYVESLRAHPDFALTTPDGFIETNPFDSISNRERRAQEDGLPVWRILAIRT